jgi:hypothetical protein
MEPWIEFLQERLSAKNLICSSINITFEANMKLASPPRRNLMRTNITTVAVLALLAGPMLCYADSSYEHTSQITGGQLINSLKNVPFISKQIKSMTDPTSEITMVHGNQKAIVSKDYTEIWDLDKEVIIHIDNTKKTYSMVSFADMRKMIEEMPAKMAEMQQRLKEEQAKEQPQKSQAPQAPPNLQFSFSTDVKDTGLSKMIGPYNATEHILTMKTIVTDTNNPGTNITYAFTNEIWTTPEVPAEMKDVEDFDMRFGKKLMEGVDAKDLMTSMTNMRNGGQMAMMQMFGANPGAGDAFAQMQKELAKITGTRVLEITRMGGSGTGMDSPPETAANGAPAPSGNQVAGQVAGDTAANTAAGETSKLGIPGSALGGALMSAWGHKKAKAATPPPAQSPTASSAGQSPTEVTLMEMTTQTHDFSHDAIPPSVFQVPVGFKQVESPMAQAMKK